MNTSMIAQGVNPMRWWQVFRQEKEWYSGEEAIRIADNILIYQLQSGGWPKNIDMAKVLSKEDIKEIRKAQKDGTKGESQATIDNQATHTQMRYLAMVYEGTGEKRFRESFLKGLDYLFEAQYENGGWPQFYPIKKGYYEHITYNDGAMMGVMNILWDVAEGNYEFVDAERRTKARKAIDKGLEVILKTQVRVDGKLTAWCAQHDKDTFEPAKARSYELPSLSGMESVDIVEYLMKIEEPGEEIINAVQGAIDWYKRTKITGVKVIYKKDSTLARGYDKIIGFDPEGAPPLWARFYEIGTNYPMFVDRDGIVKYSISEIGHERRVGYRWLGDFAVKLIEEDYPEWCEKWGID